uniref:uncharacterized protein LOC113474269 n=1 Tax=Ciona intestinalis TaxID=7719 RepID=UPI000EF45F5B|nr:uncharacterized protein LOC113474269 [Ciona intestinalis]|eukprot:XP_026690448.1 uncharacterized protein LOC113474269 [Ciona intestinalis]
MFPYSPTILYVLTINLGIAFPQGGEAGQGTEGGGFASFGEDIQRRASMLPGSSTTAVKDLQRGAMTKISSKLPFMKSVLKRASVAVPGIPIPQELSAVGGGEAGQETEGSGLASLGADIQRRASMLPGSSTAAVKDLQSGAMSKISSKVPFLKSMVKRASVAVPGIGVPSELVAGGGDKDGQQLLGMSGLPSLEGIQRRASMLPGSSTTAVKDLQSGAMSKISSKVPFLKSMVKKASVAVPEASSSSSVLQSFATSLPGKVSSSTLNVSSLTNLATSSTAASGIAENLTVKAKEDLVTIVDETKK